MNARLRGSAFAVTILLILALWAPVAASETWFEGGADALNSRTALVVVERDGRARTLMEDRADDVIFPASLVKMMTALVAYDAVRDADRSLDDAVTVHAQDLRGLAEMNASVAGLIEGEQIPLRDIFYALLLSSGADAANVLSRETYGSDEAFVAAMNVRARELGLTHTHFINTSGLFDADQVSTTRDMLQLLRAAWTEPFLRDVMSTRFRHTKATNRHEYGLAMGHTLEMYARERGIDTAVIDGGKTGRIRESGYCLASFKAVGDDTVVFICTTGADPSDGHILDHVALYEAIGTHWSDDELAALLPDVEPGGSHEDPWNDGPTPDGAGSTPPALDAVTIVFLSIIALLALTLLIGLIRKNTH
ncbi:MAG: D-alanyl-D-alanine carboxypeptidase family protein [Saccharofermentanales bacterium]|jgi:D-alanyl-D-alanine carboxypeptidase